MAAHMFVFVFLRIFNKNLAGFENCFSKNFLKESSRMNFYLFASVAFFVVKMQKVESWSTAPKIFDVGLLIDTSPLESSNTTLVNLAPPNRDGLGELIGNILVQLFGNTLSPHGIGESARLAIMLVDNQEQVTTIFHMEESVGFDESGYDKETDQQRSSPR